jgi:hypothetical protein
MKKLAGSCQSAESLEYRVCFSIQCTILQMQLSYDDLATLRMPESAKRGRSSGSDNGLPPSLLDSISEIKIDMDQVNVTYQ